MQVSLRGVIAQFKSYSLLDNMSKTEFLIFHLSKWVPILTHLLKLETHPFPWVSYGVHYPFLSVFPPTYISSLSTSLPFHCHHPCPSHPHRSFAMSSNAFPQQLVPPPITKCCNCCLLTCPLPHEFRAWFVGEMSESKWHHLLSHWRWGWRWGCEFYLLCSTRIFFL